MLGTSGMDAARGIKGQGRPLYAGPEVMAEGGKSGGEAR